MPFQKGQSGNPSGRPKGVRAAMEARYGENGTKLLDQLHAIVIEPDADLRTKVDILKYLHDKGWGKAPQSVDMDMKGDLTIAQVVHEHVKE